MARTAQVSRTSRRRCLRKLVPDKRPQRGYSRDRTVNATSSNSNASTQTEITAQFRNTLRDEQGGGVITATSWLASAGCRWSHHAQQNSRPHKHLPWQQGLRLSGGEYRRHDVHGASSAASGIRVCQTVFLSALSALHGTSQVKSSQY